MLHSDAEQTTDLNKVSSEKNSEHKIEDKKIESKSDKFDECDSEIEEDYEDDESDEDYEEDEDDEEDEDYEDDEDEDDDEEKIYDEVEEDDEDYEEDEEEDNNQNLVFILSKKILTDLTKNKRKHQQTVDTKVPTPKKQKFEQLMKKYNKHERAFFESKSESEKEAILMFEKQIENTNYISEPLRFKILRSNLDSNIKNYIVSKIENFNKMTPCSSEYSKMNNWLCDLTKIPFGIYNTLPIKNINTDIAPYLQNVKDSIDQNIFGHTETKEQIIRVLAQWASNPNSNGCVIGIQGPPGVGKTKLIKDGVCKAMNFPLAFVSLGGMSDSSYLNGHHYTYEGARYGKIVESLIKARSMNPIFLFDELDKISNTSKGEEIVNTLIHLTDPVQNDRYRDQYYEEITLDLSKSIMIFTYNDEENVNPILKDRMITIKVSGYTPNEKIALCKDYLIPELVSQYNINKNDVIFEEHLLKYIIEFHGKDEGVRNLKRVLNNILSHINTMRYIKTEGNLIELPYTVSRDFIDKYCKKEEKQSLSLMSLYT